MEVTHEDFVHTGPSTLAGRYLRMFWQPVCRSQDLPAGRAVPIRILCDNFTLYRGETGAAHIVAFRCAHRGTQLSTGWVEGDCIRCRYHGWKYEGNGQCVEQPGEDELFASKVKIGSYPTREYLGLIFAFLGEGEPSSFRRFSDMEAPGVLEACPPEYWPCNYFNRIDNACDVAHVDFTHREAVLRANRLDRLGGRKVEADETEYGIRTICEEPPQETHFHMPNANLVKANVRVEGSLHDAATVEVDRLSWRVPVDDENTVSFSIDLMHLTGEEAERYRERRRQTERLGQTLSLTGMGDAILAGKIREQDLDQRLSTASLFSVEDYVVQVGQGKVDRSYDRLGRIDVGVFLLRKIWERELRALADGRPLKQWTTPGRVISSRPRRA